MKDLRLVYTQGSGVSLPFTAGEMRCLAGVTGARDLEGQPHSNNYLWLLFLLPGLPAC